MRRAKKRTEFRTESAELIQFSLRSNGFVDSCSSVCLLCAHRQASRHTQHTHTMQKMLITYELPSDWACYLFYGDASSFDYSDSGEEQAIIDQLLADIGLGEPTDVSDESCFMTYHDARPYGILACDCSTYTFLK